MINRIFFAVCLSAWCAILVAAPPEVPKDPLKVKVGEDTVVTIRVPDGKKGAFGEGFRASDCLFFRGYSPSESEMTFLVRPKKPGFYRVVFWTVGEGDRSFLDIDAGDSPGPDPGPGPQPPSSELAKALKAAYAADTSADKAKHLASLAAIYRQAIPFVDDAKTVGVLMEDIRKVRVNMIGEGLLAVRQVIGKELNAKLPKDLATPLTADLKKLCKDEFTRMAAALEEVAK